MDDKTLISVRNRNIGSTGYSLDNGFRRNFAPNEVKKIPFDELRQLSFVPGGEDIIRDCLVIENQEALDALNLGVEPEYFYSPEDVKKILFEGSLDQLEDTLNFAPDGIIEMIKKIAVESEIPDTRKREMITKKTGFSIDNAIMVNKVMAEGQPEESKNEAPVRKSTPLKTRKTEAPATNSKYKVVG
jgi:hypothetical protein